MGCFFSLPSAGSGGVDPYSTHWDDNRVILG